jgi:non-homologous end joining protein Ku
MSDCPLPRALDSTHAVEEFAPNADIDNRYLISPYYVVPTAKQVTKAGDEPFAVIRENLPCNGQGRNRCGVHVATNPAAMSST